MSQLFCTVERDLRESAQRATILNYVGRACEMVGYFLFLIIMARLLTPRDFGIFAMVSPLLWIAMHFTDLGLGSAVTQDRDIDVQRASTLFYLNLLAGSCLGALFFVVSPLIGQVYGEPAAAHASAALSLMFVVSGLAAVQIALLRRAFLFGRLLCAQILAAVVSLLVAVALAASGAGYWAIVGRALTEPLVFAIVAWTVAPWRPCRPRVTPETRDLLRYGGYFAAYNTLSASGRQADHVLLGWRFGSAELGQYALAYRLFFLPVQQISGPLGHVMVPALSRLRGDGARLVAWYTRVLQGLASVAFPLFLTLAVCAHDVVAVVAGPQWPQAGDVLQILAPVGALQVCVVTADWLLQAHGRSDRAFRWSVMTTTVSVVSFASGLPWGATGVAWGLASASAVMAVPSLAYATNGTAIRMCDVAAALLPPCLVGVATALAVHGLNVSPFAPSGVVVRLALDGAIAGSGVACALAWLLLRWRIPARPILQAASRPIEVAADG